MSSLSTALNLYGTWTPNPPPPQPRWQSIVAEASDLLARYLAGAQRQRVPAKIACNTLHACYTLRIGTQSNHLELAAASLRQHSSPQTLSELAYWLVKLNAYEEELYDTIAELYATLAN